MAVNLATKYEKQFAAAFKPNSYFEGKTNTKFSFDGAKTIKIMSPVTVELESYSRTGTARYGTPTEMDNLVQELSLSQDKGFTKTLDRGNYSDQMMSVSAGAWMNEQIKSKVTPTTEKYALAQWIANAGKIDTISAKPAKSTIVEGLAQGIQRLSDAFVPDENRYLYMTAEMFNVLKTSTEFVSLDSIAGKALTKGILGQFMGARVVVLPSSYFPSNSYAFAAYKESVLLPRKISSFKTHNNPPGIDGWLMEGRIYYDAFVLGAMSGGTWALVLAANQQAAPTVTYTGGSTDTIAITSSNATTIKYTLDGSDPRYSPTAKTYSSAISTSDWTAGTYTVKAVAYRTGNYFTSNVTTTDCAVSAS